MSVDCTHRGTSFTRATVFYDAGRQSVRVHRCIRCEQLFFSKDNNLTAQQRAGVLTVLFAFSGQEFTVISAGSQEMQMPPAPAPTPTPPQAPAQEPSHV